MIRFENLKKHKSLIHFSTTTEGGVSKGNYSSFNLGLHSGDILESVQENRRRLAETLNISDNALYTPYQTHQDNILIIDEAFTRQSDEDKLNLLNGIDAVITSEKNIAIGISTADCVPLLIYDPVNHVLAAIHAGWRGTVAKIVNKVVNKMQKEYSSSPTTLLSVIGPAISQKHFEVGNEVVQEFAEKGFSLNKISYKNADSGKMHIDLKLANKILLEESGILSENIEVSELCTYSSPNFLFSARRQTIHSGRMITGGVLK